jgi:hypothetical protein
MRNWNVFNKFHKYHMKILLYFYAKVGTEDILTDNWERKFTQN